MLSGQRIWLAAAAETLDVVDLDHLGAKVAQQYAGVRPIYQTRACLVLQSTSLPFFVVLASHPQG